MAGPKPDPMRNAMHMIRLVLLLGATLAPLSLAEGHAGDPPPRTNIVLIMADDLGWMDLHVQGNSRVDTPNLDRLAAQGMRFTSAYAAAPVCSPVRAAIMTGLAPARLHITNHIPENGRFTPKDALLEPAESENQLSEEYVTIAERLKAAGYATGFFGKWHLSGKSGKEGVGDLTTYPEAQGFDSNLGGCALGGPPTFFDPYRIHNLPPRKKGEYLADRLADEASDFITSKKDEPFFLCLWTYTVHWPMEAPTDLVAKYEERKGPGVKDPRYAAMTEAMDAAIGRVLSTLDEQGLSERTLVIFTSDNGGYQGVADNRPLREGKGYLYEGGTRVPLFVRWPGVTQAGSLSAVPVISMDLNPTILNAAGLQVAPGVPCDGEDLEPLLRGTGGLERKALFWHYPNYAWHRSNRLGASMRSGRWKLIERFDDGSLELYDLAADLSESRDLSDVYEQRTEAMRSDLAAWLKETGARMPSRR